MLKLHENERIRTKKGASLAPLWIATEFHTTFECVSEMAYPNLNQSISVKYNPLKRLFSHIRLTPPPLTFWFIQVTGRLRRSSVSEPIQTVNRQTRRQIDMRTVCPSLMQQVHEPPYVEESHCRFIASLLSDTDKQDITERRLEKKTFLSTLLFLNETGT